MIAIEAKNLTYRFEGAEMRFDLQVEEGEWLAIVGPSGAGKSTLLDLFAGFLEPDGGMLSILGRSMAAQPPADRPVSCVFQDNNLFPHLSALDNVALGLSPTLRRDAKIKGQAEAALERVGLVGFAGRRPFEMSGGERQRVAIARALARNRPILLLDEAFAALGPALRRTMLELLTELRSAAAPKPPTVVMVTHQPEDARGFADRVAFLAKGRIRAVGTVSDVLDGPQDPQVRAYLGLPASLDDS